MRFFRKKKRQEQLNPLERVLPRYTGFLTVSELAHVLRVSATCIYYWLGYGFETRWKMLGFPRPEMRKKKIVFRVEEIRDFFDIEVKSPFIQPLLSVKDLVKITGYSERSVRNWFLEMKTKELGHRLVRVEKEELERFLAERYGWQKDGESDREVCGAIGTSVLDRLRKKEKERERVVNS